MLCFCFYFDLFPSLITFLIILSGIGSGVIVCRPTISLYQGESMPPNLEWFLLDHVQCTLQFCPKGCLWSPCQLWLIVCPKFNLSMYVEIHFDSSDDFPWAHDSWCTSWMLQCVYRCDNKLDEVNDNLVRHALFVWAFTHDATASFLDTLNVLVNVSHLFSCCCCIDYYGINWVFQLLEFHVHETCSLQTENSCSPLLHFSVREDYGSPRFL